MGEPKMLPIGIEDFKKIRNDNYYYVDKTNIVSTLLNDRSKVTLFTRPRRFGKSLNMSMLRHFFEIGTDPKLFEGLRIAQDNLLCETYMGKFPVIYISLKGVAGFNYDEAHHMLFDIICNEIQRHSYLMQSPLLSDYDRQKLEFFLKSEMSNTPTAQSLLFLSQMLHKHHNQKVIILIDEYDVPLAKAYEYGYYEQMVVLIRNLLHQTLKTNENLQLAVLTGCMRIAKESIFTGLNNLKIRSIMDLQYDEYFGFTDSEVKELLAYYKLDSYYPTAKSWYDGYTFGNVSVYCPWDVINYVYDLRFDPYMYPQNYWSNTSSNDIIRKLLNKATATTRRELELLIEGQSIEKTIFPELTYAELDKTIDHLWSVLFTTGYLTYEQSDRIPTQKNTYFFQANKLRLKIPNDEVRYIFKEQILSWFQDFVQTDAERYTHFCQTFLDGNAPKIQEMFNLYLRDMISIRDTSVRKSMKENFYHGILLGILNFRTDWYVSSNQEAGEGYNDIMIMHDDTQTGIIIEVKYAENDNLDGECAKALEQIEKLHYTDVLMQYEPVKIYKYAIACYKKHCKVLVKEEERR